MKTFGFTHPLPCSCDELAAWHYRKGAFERLSAPWNEPKVLNPEVTVSKGALMKFVVKMGLLNIPWEAEITQASKQGFTDLQRKGLFRFWKHEHHFREAPSSQSSNSSQQACLIQDDIHFKGPFPSLISEAIAARELKRLMAYRHRLFEDDFALAREFKNATALKLLITGGTGLIGSALTHLATTQGHEVTVLTRCPSTAHEREWNPASGKLSSETIELLAQSDAVIHLAGANVAGKRWNAKRKQVILESRTQPTKLLAKAIAQLPAHERPQAFVCASGISGLPVDGSPADETQPLNRSSFLGEVVAQWEEATHAARAVGVRTIHARLPPVLDPRGGMLAKVLPLFQLGLGGPFGNPQEHFAWIALQDVIELLLRACLDSRYEGAIHLSSAQTVTRAQFARALGAALHRPAFLPAPSFALKAAMGAEMATQTALANLNPIPAVLENLGYQYRYSDINDALNHMLGTSLASPTSQN